METSESTGQLPRIHEEFLALLERGRRIKARRQKEAEEWLTESQNFCA